MWTDEQTYTRDGAESRLSQFCELAKNIRKQFLKSECSINTDMGYVESGRLECDRLCSPADIHRRFGGTFSLA